MELKTIEAIKYIAENFGVSSMYALSKALSDETLTVQPIQIKHYINGNKMTKKVAQRFYDTYGIIITDVHDRGLLGELESASIQTSD